MVSSLIPDGSAGSPPAPLPTPGDSALLTALGRLLRDHAGDPLAWIAAPPLWAHHAVYGDAAVAVTGRPRQALVLRRRAAAAGRSLLRPERVRERYEVAGEAILACTTENQRRSLRPLVRAGRDAVDTPAPAARASVFRLARLTADARDLAGELVDELQRENAAFPGGALVVYETFFSAAQQLAHAEALFRLRKPAVVVAASNHDIAARALLLVARRHGVPSVFVPHAPMLSDTRLRDMPTDYAALRGPREAAWYVGQGADAAHAVAVGDPGLDPSPEIVHVTNDAPVVFAPSPYADAVVSDQVRMLASATSGPVVVTPHPRQRLDHLGDVMPEHWELYRGRTYARLREGAAAVVQSSSGVALESLQLGIPVVELSAPGGEPLYPFLDTDLVPAARTSDELGAHLRALADEVRDPRYRRRLVDHARQWCCDGGTSAATKASELIRVAAGRGPASSPVFDAWDTDRW